MVGKKHTLTRACALALLGIGPGMGIAAPALAQNAAAEPTAAEQMQAARNNAHASAAQTYAVTIALIEELIKAGVLTVERAQAMLDHAERQAALARQNEAAPPPTSVRVPYVSESVKKAMREELRKEIAEQAKTERWGAPGALPEWLSRIEFSGDFRLRYHSEDFAEDNYDTLPDVQAINDAGGVANGSYPLLNTTEDRIRLRYRARVNLGAKVTDGVKVHVALASGEDSGPISTNKTLGDYWRKDSIWLDRAYIEAKPWKGVTFTGGRVPNPFFSTDLVWDTDLNFEGAALNGNYAFGNAGKSSVFATVGAFPLQERALYSDRWLYAGQLGGTLPVGAVGFKLGAAYYEFTDVQGERNDFQSRLKDYTRPPLLAQGNSIFNIRNDAQTSLAGLASEFELFNLVAQAEYRFGGDKAVRFTVDYVQNLAMDEDDIERLRNEPGGVPAGDTGWAVRAFLGNTKIARRHDWSFEVGYKRLETDAVLDAFTDSDFGVYGGTDIKGYTVEGNYGVTDHTWVALKWLSADAIDRPPFSADVLLLDLNTRF